jgi:two-component system LytT family response regulator
MKIRVVVADDQPMARERLLALLAEERDVEVVAAAASGSEAVAAVRRHAPDLVFLDMQMPELDGLGVIEEIGLDRMPTTIFVTAFDRYAVQAFEVHALDYLLKPFGRGRFQQALARAREHLARHRAGALTERLLRLVEELRGSPAGASGPRVLVRSSGRVSFVDVDDIDWIEAEGNYVRLHVGDSTHLLRETMSHLLSRLGEQRFFRIHRSRIVNVSRIKDILVAGGGDYEVLFHSGLRLGLSRSYRDALQERLMKGSS